jgi:hypothetical protein
MKTMKTMMTRLSAVTFVSLFAVGAAQADSILAQADDGNVWRIDIAGGNVTGETMLSGFTDLPPVKEGNTPNGLANVNGSIFRSSFDTINSTFTPKIYEVNSEFATASEGVATKSAIAGAGGFGSVYYYATGTGAIASLETSGGAPGVQKLLGQLSDGVTQYGDLAVRSVDAQGAATLILSYDTSSGSKLVSFDTGTQTTTSIAGFDGLTKFAGLAFSNGTLYGVRAKNEGPGTTAIYAINLGTGAYAALGDGAGSTYFSKNTYTDAANVPIPAAAWLFGSALIGAVGLGRRKRNSAAKA